MEAAPVRTGLIRAKLANNNTKVDSPRGINALYVPPLRPRRRGRLIFDAEFESGIIREAIEADMATSGNLGEVHAISDNEYELLIRPDSNNPKFRVWFYFGVRNAKPGQHVLFHIKNFSKTSMSFRNGMTPVCRFLPGEW